MLIVFELIINNSIPQLYKNSLLMSIKILASFENRQKKRAIYYMAQLKDKWFGKVADKNYKFKTYFEHAYILKTTSYH